MKNRKLVKCRKGFTVMLICLGLFGGFLLSFTKFLPKIHSDSYMGISSQLRSSNSEEITIIGNEMLAEIATSGGGLAEDPYIIENLLLVKPDCPYALGLFNITVHCIIRNCGFLGAGGLGGGSGLLPGAGLYLESVEHLRIENCTVLNNNVGIKANDCKDISLNLMNITYNWGPGGYFLNCSNITLENCNFQGNSHSNLKIVQSTHVELSYAHFSGPYTSTGVYLENVERVGISWCNFTNHEDQGIFIEGETNDDVIIALNAFLDNAENHVVLNHSGAPIHWDTGVFGNYWNGFAIGSNNSCVGESPMELPNLHAQAQSPTEMDHYPLVFSPFDVRFLACNETMNSPVVTSEGEQSDTPLTIRGYMGLFLVIGIISTIHLMVLNRRRKDEQ